MNYKTVKNDRGEADVYVHHRLPTNRTATIIALSGPARHGKDTSCAAFINNFAELGKKAKRMAHADLLKFIAFGTLDDSWKENATPEEIAEKRDILQKLGSRFREKRPDFWVDYLLSLLDQNIDNLEYAVISDCRYPNEIDGYRDAGYQTIHVRIVRPGFVSDLSEEAKNHPSETALNDYPVDILIENDGTLEELNAKIATIVADLIGKEND